MSKAGLDLKDFSIATRRPEATPVKAVKVAEPVEPAAKDETDATMLPKPSARERRETAETRALAQEDVRQSLKNLKRSKQRVAKFFINIALDYDLKARLQRASLENDLKMTQVVKAALDYYLTENGY